jgi:putative FmdB family regulatory protein
MPLYEYQCTGCGQRIEVLRRFSDAPLVECPHCGGVLTKLASAPALQFKGSGFYLTDYGRAGGDRRTEGGGEKADGAKADAAKDATSDAAKEAKSSGETKEAKPSTGSKPATDSKPAPAVDKKTS